MKVSSFLLFCLITTLFACQQGPTNASIATATVAPIKKEHPKEITKASTLALFDKYCASCHGTSLEEFVQRDWQNGHSWNEVYTSIAVKHQAIKGAASLKILSEQELTKLTDHILYAIESTTIESFDVEADWSGLIQSEVQNFRLDTVAKGVGIPWGFDFLPTGDLIITDREGTLYYQHVGGKKKTIKGLPKIKATGQGGLLDVALHPDFEKNQLLYFSYSKPKGISESTTSVVKAKLVNYQLTEQEEILEALPYHNSRNHFGSRLQFDSKGYLFISIGDRFRRDENPQDLSRHAGKIHRLHADGSIPLDNPFVNRKNAIASIWSYGHRNPQGLAYDTETDILWESEHAPRGGDEINLIQKGLNYGWPIVSYGINYSGSVFTKKTEQKGMEQPTHYYVPSPALSGLAIVNSDKYPNWKGNLMAGSLRLQYLSRLIVKDNQVQKEERLLENIGRVRSVEMGKDGYLYIGVERPGFVFRLMPI